MKKGIILSTAALMLAASIGSAQLAVNVPTEGTGVSVTGSGAPADAPVELFVNDVSQGSVFADGSGDFSFVVDLTAGDILTAQIARVWNFNTDGDSEGWAPIGGPTVVAGGVMTVTNDGSNGAGASNIDINLAGGTVFSSPETCRAFEMRYAINGSFSPSSSTVITDAGGGFGFGAGWNPFNTGGAFVTTYVDLGTDGTGAATNWVGATDITQIDVAASGFGIGDTIAIDYIRVKESMSWEFRIDGDFQGLAVTGGTGSVSGGSLNLEATAANQLLQVSPLFVQVDGTYFNQFSAGVSTTTDPFSNGLNTAAFNYLRTNDGFSGAGYTSIVYNGDGTSQVVTADGTQAPSYGTGAFSAGPNAINNGGFFQAGTAAAASDVISVDYIRISPASAVGPAAPVTALVDTSVNDWMMLDN